MSTFAKKLRWCVLVVGLSLAGFAQAETAAELERTFQSPPVAARPWAYWWWLNSNVTREGITRDLEEMKRQGIQGVMIFNAGGGETPKGPKFLSPEWKSLFKFALSEIDRLGMEASVNLCDGWCAGGPWITPEAANKKLTWSETQVEGPRSVSQTLPVPPTFDGYYRDVAVLAVRESPTRPVQPADIRTNFPCSYSSDFDYEYHWRTPDAADRDPNTAWKPGVVPTAEKPVWLEYVYSEPLAASAVYLAGDKTNGPRACELQASDDGKQFQSLATFEMPQGEAKTIEFPETAAKIFRLVVKSVHGKDARVSEMWLLRKGDEPALRPGIKWWLHKSGNRSFWHFPKEGPAVMEEEYPEDGASDCKSKETIDITSKMSKNGTLAWDVPKGRWTVFRFGYTLEGQRTRCSSTVIGYEADMLDPVGVETHFKHCAEPLLDAAREYTGKTLKYFHVDSYETGADVEGQQPTWSAIFLDEFRKRRGYDPLPYLPAMARRIVDNRAITNRFLADIRMTISDLMIDCFYGRLSDLAHARRMGTHCESGYGTYPHQQFDGLLAASKDDVTMGEFWWGTNVMTLSEHYCNSIRSVASPAHIYGKKIVQAESFTSWSHFPEYPATLKPVGDLAFCDGLNRVMFHQSTHQPNEDMPGYQYFAGTHIDRHVTWWNMAKPFLTYLTRCQSILQAGRFHADVCYFYGEGTAKYVPTKKFLKPELPPGYNFDCVNADVVLNQMTVKDHKLDLPSGMSYRLMVLPTDRTMSPAVLRKIKKLIEDGATVLGDKPLRTTGLTNWPTSDQELETMANSMWGKNPKQNGKQAIGKGRLVWGCTSGELLESLGTQPDFEVGGDNEGFEFIHRVIHGGDFYFVSNQTNEAQSDLFSFRLTDRIPEVWDPVTGEKREVNAYHRCRPGTIRIPMEFEPHQSFFFVFRKPVKNPIESGGRSNFPDLKDIAELTGPWNVAFDPKWGGPEKIVFEKLDDWTKRPEPGIKYYSGTAVYRKTFDLPALPKEKEKLFLDLGKVDYVARVKLNGRDLGVVWTAPWRVDISGVVKEKGNELEIEVVNTWLNRLVGDAQLPPEKRLAKTNATYPPNEPLMPSGLLGPVTIKKEK
jgi:hypothetical protein